MSVDTTKGNAYAVLGPLPDRAAVTKGAAYVVLAAPLHLQVATKGVTYVVLVPPVASAAPRVFVRVID